MFARAHQRHREFPARKGIARTRDVHLLRDLVQQLAGLRIFDQRQQRGLGDLHHGALGFDVKAADGLDQVAEQLDADGLGRLGREDVEDAAAQRVFADHLDRLALLVADAFQMRQQVFERNLLAHSQRESELPVEFGRLRAEQSRSHRCNGNGSFARSQTPQADRALLGDLVVRREALRRKYVDGRNRLRTREIGGHKNIEECFHQLAQRVGFLITVHQDQEIPLGGLPEQNQVQSFGRGGEARERKAGVRIASKPADHVLKRGVAAERLKEVANSGMRHKSS